MTEDERKLLLDSARSIVELSHDRDDIVIGLTAAVLDLYRVAFRDGLQIKQQAIARLQVQQDDLRRYRGAHGVKFLGFLMDALSTDKLDAAKLLRDPAVGSA